MYMFNLSLVPLVTPTVSIMLLWNETRINFSMKVSESESIYSSKFFSHNNFRLTNYVLESILMI